jgi:membrane-associated phospholipid phosphatase
MELPHRERYILLFTISIILSFLLMMDVRLHAVPLLDQWTSAYPETLEGTFWYSLFRWITELGSSTVLSVLAFVFGLFLVVKRKDLIGAGIVFTATALGYQFNFLIKGMVQRERPLVLAIVDGEGFSFPSGHAMVSFITYGIIVYFLWKHLKKELRLTIAVLAGLLVLLIGISRYVLRVHYLTDILGGYLFGLIFLIIWILLYKWLRHKYGRQKVRSH